MSVDFASIQESVRVEFEKRHDNKPLTYNRETYELTDSAGRVLAIIAPDTFDTLMEDQLKLREAKAP